MTISTVTKITKTIKRAARIALKVILTAACSAAVLLALTNLYVICRTEKYLDKDNSGGSYDCIIVLGCSVLEDKTPSPFLEDRLKTAIELYNSGIAPRILLSGDNSGGGYNEVGVMFNYCVDAGVPEEDIFLDHFGYSTYETMMRAATVFNVKSAVVVTQHYHLARSVYDARAFGIDAAGVSAGNSGYVIGLHNYLREMLARPKDLIFDIVKPDIKDHNEEYDIGGSGLETQSAGYYEDHN